MQRNQAVMHKVEGCQLLREPPPPPPPLHRVPRVCTVRMAKCSFVKVGSGCIAAGKDACQDLHANQPSSSSRRVRAGRGAPGPSSVVGSLTYPSLFQGFNFDNVFMMGFGLLVFAVCSRRDQPSSFILSAKDCDAMVAVMWVDEERIWSGINGLRSMPQ